MKWGVRWWRHFRALLSERLFEMIMTIQPICLHKIFNSVAGWWERKRWERARKVNVKHEFLLHTVQHYRIYLSPGADGICSCNFTWCHHVGLVSKEKLLRKRVNLHTNVKCNFKHPLHIKINETIFCLKMFYSQAHFLSQTTNLKSTVM